MYSNGEDLVVAETQRDAALAELVQLRGELAGLVAERDEARLALAREQRQQVESIANLCAEQSAFADRKNAHLQTIAEWAHGRSSGPEIEDDLWEIRRMAYAALDDDVLSVSCNQATEAALAQEKARAERAEAAEAETRGLYHAALAELEEAKRQAADTRQDALNAAWRAVDAQGGSHNGVDRAWGEGYDAALNYACEAIAKLGGKDPDPDVGALRRQLTSALARTDELADHLQWVLPMTKGYAAEHPVGSNADKIVGAEKALSSAKGAGG